MRLIITALLASLVLAPAAFAECSGDSCPALCEVRVWASSGVGYRTVWIEKPFGGCPTREPQERWAGADSERWERRQAADDYDDYATDADDY